MWLGITIMFAILGYMILMIWLARTGFLPTIFLIIKVQQVLFPLFSLLSKFIYEIRQTWILVIISILSIIGHNNHVYLIGIHDTEALDLQEKAFLSTIFIITKVHPWNDLNLDAHNKIHSFGYWRNNHVLLIGIHDIVALDLREKLFFPPFSL